MKTINTMKNNIKLRTGKNLVESWLLRGLFLLPTLFILSVGQIWADYTWYSGDLLYYDFTAVTSGGVNWHNGSSLQYDASGYGKVKKVEFSSTVTMNDTWVIAKTGKGSWADIKFSNPTSVNQRRFIINAAGTSGSWGYLDKYIAGDNWGGVGNWSTTTKKMTNNNNGSYTVTLTSVAASAHKFKITNYDTWTGAVGYSANVSCVNGTVADDGTGNIQFTPYIAGSVTITYNGTNVVITCPGIPVTLDNQSATTAGSASVTATYGSAMPSATMPTKNYYDFGGYWTNTGGSGTKYYNTDGSSAKNCDLTVATTLYAYWTPKTYTITYKDQGNVAYSGSNSASLPSSYTYGTGIATLTDGVRSGYRFDGWFDNSSCTGSAITSISSSANGNKTFYAKWTENPGGTITLTAGTGGEVSKDNSSWGTSKSYTGIKSTTPLNIYARANTGYTFSAWSKTSGSGTITSTSSASTTFTPVADADAALTASFSENKSSLTTSNHFDAGDPSYAIPTKSVSSIGIATTATLTATTPGTGYTFAGWTLSSNLVVTSGNAATDLSITVRTNGNGAAATAQANYEEDLSSPWIVAGGNKIVTTGTTWRTTADANNSMLKKTGHSTESMVYFTVPISTICSGENNGNYQFKIYNTSTSKWYGLAADGSSYYLLKAEDGTEKSLVQDNKNIELRAYVTGDYEFKLDYSTSTPKLTVTWPNINQLQIYTANNSGTGDAAIGNWDWTSTAGTVYSKTVSLQAKTQYKFKVVYHSDYYGFKTGSPASGDNNPENPMTIDNCTDWRLYDDGGDSHLYAPVAGDYTFQFNSNNAGNTTLSVTFPTAYTVTFGSDGHGTVTASATSAGGSIESGDYVKAGDDVTFTQTPATGYTFKGWYTTSDGNTTVSTMGVSDNVLNSIGANKTVYAQYTPKSCTVNFDFDESDPGYGSKTGATTSVTATYGSAMTTVTPPTAANGYAFMGYFSSADGMGTQYYNADGTSKRTWNVDTESAQTLYAFYKKAEVTAITLSPANPEPGAAVTATATISPTPTGNTVVCWRVLHDNDNPLDPQPVFDPTSATGTSVSFTAPSTSANYKIEAKLQTGLTCGGTELHTRVETFIVAGSHTVTLNCKHGDVLLKTGSVSIAAFEETEVTAPEIIGYTFDSWTLGGGIYIETGSTTTSTIGITAIYETTLTANYTPKRMIYFMNTLGWSGVNVYFYKNDTYWNASNGTGADPSYTFTNTPYSEGKHGTMTQIEGTNIYYFDAEAAGVNASYDDVAFTEADQHGYGYFYDTKIVRRGDYKSALPMFVPIEQTPTPMNGGHAQYYNEGYWMNYPENTGYTLRIYPAWNSNNATGASREYYFPYSADTKMPLKLDAEFNYTGKAWYMIYRNDGQLLGKNYSMTQTNHETDLDSGSDQKIELNTTAPGVYTFTLSFHDNGGSPKAYKYYVNVDYPVGEGDYRIYYSDNGTWSQGAAHAAGWHHSSDIIRKNNGSEEKADTVSLFVSSGSSPVAKFQYVSGINAGTGAVTWTDVPSGTIDLSGIDEAGVYNFIVSQPSGGASISLTKTEEYTGNYYIRTDCAGNTKWDNFRTRDHQMTYTEFSMSAANSFGDKFSHYFAHWCPAGTNVKFCIANDYSTCISDTLIQDVGNPFNNIDAGGTLKSDGSADETVNIYSANIRFMYNETTNKISRAYVSAASNKARQFLVIKGNATILNEDNSALSGTGESAANHEAIFIDNENFIYERILKVIPGTLFKLYACYAKNPIDVTKAQYFRGAYDGGNFTENTNSVVLLGGTGDAQKIRILYDFKTNRLVAAWMPSGTAVSGTLDINADVMIVRDHQGPAECITFANESSKLDGVKTVYGAMKFNRWTLNNRLRGIGGVEDNDKDHCATSSAIETYHGILGVKDQKTLYERSLYFISFPFDVKVSEIFGFGHYWDEWYLEYYDGLTRAQNGYWKDSPPNWKYVTPEMAEDFVLEAYKGYILGLDLDYMEYDNTTFWANNISNVELYFPSQTTMTTIKQTEVTIPALSEEYRCTINRGGTDGDRRVKDSFWRCIGVPSYDEFAGELKAGKGGATINWQPEGDNFPFLYAWNMDDNTLTPQATSTFAFKPMHAYLVQIQNAIYWNMVSATPSSIVARREHAANTTEYSWRLELQKDSAFVDQAYIRMSDNEQVTDTFDFGQDLSKELNYTRSNIYTMLGYERLAANSIPVKRTNTTTIPVGLNIKTTGDYTFAMPDGTSGVGVTLVDNVTNVRTSLSALDYTVNLTAGDYTDRFFLEISPVQETPTDIVNTGDGIDGNARKMIIDGLLYIVRDGKMYDATGARVE